jgi:methyltransferase
MPSLIVPAIVFVPMLVEAAIAARHERAQLARGGVEPRDDVYRLMRVAYPASFAAMIVEGLVRGSSPSAVTLAGAVVFGLAKALKWWAIASLGPAWTFRVIVVPGAALVTGGPYRWLRHPNYVAVVGELVGVGLMTQGVLTAFAAVTGFGVLLAKRIRVEERALEQAARDAAPASKRERAARSQGRRTATRGRSEQG